MILSECEPLTEKFYLKNMITLLLSLKFIMSKVSDDFVTSAIHALILILFIF